MIKLICDILEGSINYIIGGLAVIELCLAFFSGVNLYKFKKEIDHLTQPQTIKRKRIRKIAKGRIAKEEESVKEKDWSEFDTFLKDYQHKIGLYALFSLLIQLFTLLGILGTVSGLYIAIYNQLDIYEGVKFALSSTVWGIIGAIVFKIVDVFLEALLLNYVEDGIARYKAEYSVDNESIQNEYLNFCTRDNLLDNKVGELS